MSNIVYGIRYMRKGENEERTGWTTDKALVDECKTNGNYPGWSAGDDVGMAGEYNDASKEQFKKDGGIENIGDKKISKGLKEAIAERGVLS